MCIFSRIDDFDSLLKRNEMDSFLMRIVRGNEKSMTYESNC